MSIGPDLWMQALRGETRRAPSRAPRGEERRLTRWSLAHPRAARALGVAGFLTVTSGLALGAWVVAPPATQPAAPRPATTSLAAPSAPAASVAAEPAAAERAASYVAPGSGILRGPAHSIRVHTHLRLPLEQDVERVAVGSEEILSASPLNTRELLVLGKAPGQTSVLVWYDDGAVEQIDVVVVADLSLLERTLEAIHPSLRVEKAPDRDALVLTGRVPRAIYARRAEDVARSWVEASPMSRELLVGAAAASVADAQTSAAVGERRPRRGGQVINLIQVEGMPEYGASAGVEEQLLDAIRSVGGEKVTVRRIQKGPVPDDEVDVLVLEGEVPDQVALSRVLSLAYKVFVGSVKGPDVTLTDGVTNTTRVFEGDDLAIGDDIQVIADEAGSLFSADSQNNQQTQGLLSGLGQGVGTGGGQTNLGRSGLSNRVESNIGRAAALELAGGRILSFIEVRDLPQVRVDIRLYEVNRTKLMGFESEVGLITGDFTQGGLNPAGSTTSLQGASAARVGSSGKDVQNALAFLDGSFSNQLQFSGSNWAVDSLFELLEQEDIARSLANPTLSVLSGELALFQVGGRVPIEQAFGTQVGIQGVFNTVSFVEFGVNLAVRPLVGERDFITIDFAPEIITPDALLTQAIVEATGANPTTFAFESRLLRSSARLADGQTLLVGGLQQSQRSDSQKAAPWLKDVPLLGLLFQGVEYSDDDLEVVVMIRPTIVRDPLPDVALWAFPTRDELLQAAMESGAAPAPAPAPQPAQEPTDGQPSEEEPATGAAPARGHRQGVVISEASEGAVVVRGVVR